ncbi:unnamed protein product [Caenorhabditis brenneri]
MDTRAKNIAREPKTKRLWLSFHSTISATVVWLFIIGVADDITMDVSIHEKNLKSVIYFQIAGILILPILTIFHRTWSEMAIIGLGQLNFMLISSWSMADYLTLNESELGLRQRNNPIGRRDEEDDEDLELSDSDSEVSGSESSVKETMEAVQNVKTCKICLHRFSENSKRKTPLILVKCGHTLCWKCCALIKKQNYNFGIPCPFCREVTYIGSLKQLPKNYAIIEMVRRP